MDPAVYMHSAHSSVRICSATATARISVVSTMRRMNARHLGATVNLCVVGMQEESLSKEPKE